MAAKELETSAGSLKRKMHKAFTGVFLAASSLAAAQNSYLTHPDIHGNQVVFTAEGDLWLGDLTSGSAKRITSADGTETDAHFSPDGKWIAFSGQYEGGQDVYVMPVEGGPPKRLTYDPIGALSSSRGAQVLGWTPDGASILFRSHRDTGIVEVNHLFTVSASGGTPKMLPVPRGEFGSMSHDGLLAYVPVSFEWANWFHYQGGSADKVWLADLKGKTFRKVTDDLSVDTTPVWVGKDIYFVSERSGTSNLWKVDPASHSAKQCTFYTDAPVRYPSSDGKRVIFQHGAHLAVFDDTSGKPQELEFALNSDRIHERKQRIALGPEVGPVTFYGNGGGIGRLGNGISLGPTGKRLLLEARGQIVSIASEAGDMRVLENMPGSRARFPVWAPDGKSFAFLSDRSGENEIWIGNAAGGAEPKQLTHGLAANPFPFKYSPDGKWLAMQDRNGRTLLVDAASGAIKVVDVVDRDNSYDNNPGTVVFSPDSKLMAFAALQSNWLYGVKLYEISSGKKVATTPWEVNCYAPAFDATGKFLIYLADNDMSPTMSNVTGKYYLDKPTRIVMLALTADAKSPFLPKNDEEGEEADAKAKADQSKQKQPIAAGIDWDNLGKRIVPLPLPSSRYVSVDAFPDHLLILDQADNPGPSGPPSGGNTLFSYDLSARSLVPIIEGIDTYQKSFDGHKILYANGRSISVHDLVPAPTNMGAGAINFAPYTITYDPRAEWKEAFEESWRIARDFYYDPKLHGLDWDAVRKRYEARLKFVGDRRDLTRLLEDMVSELNTGHSYITDPSPSGPRENIGFLGADFESVPQSKALRIKHILKADIWDPQDSSPLLAPGLDIKEGDYILEVAGQPIDGDRDINELMLGTFGQTVAIMVNSTPSRTGARVVRVRPLPTEYTLRYEEWVAGRLDYVKKNGGENFGYCHIPDMETGGLVGFLKGMTAYPYKSAMIYDARYNGGGFVSSLLLQDIASYPTAWFKPRYGEPWTREGWANIGHKVALCNEYNFSDGELFVEDWKYMKLGPVVGTRTGGGEVGSGGGYELIDHGSIYVPNYGAYRNGEWMIEGKGATPTVPVEEDPNEVMAGKDPQLDRAIALMKAAVAKDPVTIPQHPPFPVEKRTTKN